MQSGDRVEFEAVMRKLCAGMDVPATDERIEAYWTGLSQMSLIQFARVVEKVLGPDGGFDRLPKAPQIWTILKSLRAGPTQKSFGNAIAPTQSRWLQYINGLFLRYVAHRRLNDGFKGDMNLEERRAECLQLAKWYEDLEADDSPAEFADVKRAFHSAMGRILDVEELEEA